MAKIIAASPYKKELQKRNNVERKQINGNFSIIIMRVSYFFGVRMDTMPKIYNVGRILFC
jgi:hypothetical protein